MRSSTGGWDGGVRRRVRVAGCVVVSLGLAGCSFWWGQLREWQFSCSKTGLGTRGGRCVGWVGKNVSDGCGGPSWDRWIGMRWGQFGEGGCGKVSWVGQVGVR